MTEHYQEMVVCPHCDGDGKFIIVENASGLGDQQEEILYDPCTVCNGTGYITEYELKDYIDEEKADRDRHDC